MVINPMMKKKNMVTVFLTMALCFSLSLFVILGESPVSGQAINADKVEAVAVLTRYLDALFAGDIQRLEMLLGEKYLKKRKKLLSSSNYSNFLADRYRNASFEITNYKAKKKNKVRIDVVITLATQERIKSRFTLKRAKKASETPSTFLIDKEKEQEDEEGKVKHQEFTRP